MRGPNLAFEDHKVNIESALDQQHPPEQSCIHPAASPTSPSPTTLEGILYKKSQLL